MSRVPGRRSQKRFLLNGAESSPDYLWWVPLTYASRGSPDFNTTSPSTWLRKKPQMSLRGQSINPRRSGHPAVDGRPHVRSNVDELFHQLATTIFVLVIYLSNFAKSFVLFILYKSIAFLLKNNNLFKSANAIFLFSFFVEVITSLMMTPNKTSILWPRVFPDMPPADQWVIFNVQETGYYKVNYDNQNWQLIISQLNSEHMAIHAINRAQVSQL